MLGDNSPKSLGTLIEKASFPIRGKCKQDKKVEWTR